MKTEYHIVDGLFEEKVFKTWQSDFMTNLTWYYVPKVATVEETLKKDNYYFMHMFAIQDVVSRTQSANLKYPVPTGNNFDEFEIKDKVMPVSNYYKMVEGIVDHLNPNIMFRIKANMYPTSNELIHHKNHIDFNFDNKGAIFYVNTNDGKTVLEDGTEIDSVENRMLFFNASRPHHSTNCTDENVRVNINFNYI